MLMGALLGIKRNPLGENKMEVPLGENKMEVPLGENKMGVRLGVNKRESLLGVNKTEGPLVKRIEVKSLVVGTSHLMEVVGQAGV